MKLHTIQMAKWRECVRRGLDFYDVTVKSGDKIFAPSWGLLSDYKSGKCNEEEYTERYLKEMRESYRVNKEHWLDFINREEVVIACYCKSCGFCHRYILVDIFRKLCKSYNMKFEYKGEIL